MKYINIIGGFGGGGVLDARHPLLDPILSFLHTFSLKSARIGGPRPPPPPTGNPGSATEYYPSMLKKERALFSLTSVQDEASTLASVGGSDMYKILASKQDVSIGTHLRPIALLLRLAPWSSAFTKKLPFM